MDNDRDRVLLVIASAWKASLREIPTNLFPYHYDGIDYLPFRHGCRKVSKIIIFVVW